MTQIWIVIWIAMEVIGVMLILASAILIVRAISQEKRRRRIEDDNVETPKVR